MLQSLEAFLWAESVLGKNILNFVHCNCSLSVCAVRSLFCMLVKCVSLCVICISPWTDVSYPSEWLNESTHEFLKYLNVTDTSKLLLKLCKGKVCCRIWVLRYRDRAPCIVNLSIRYVTVIVCFMLRPLYLHRHLDRTRIGPNTDLCILVKQKIPVS